MRLGDVDLLLVERDPERPAPPPPDVTERWLLDDPYRLAIPATWSTPSALDDLADRPWIDGPTGSAASRNLDTLRAATGSTLTTEHWCHEFPAVLAVVAAGLGAALVPDLALTDGPPPNVRVVNLPGLGTRSIHLAHLDSNSVRAVTRLVSDALTEAARST